MAISGGGILLSRLLNAVALFYILKVFTAAELGTVTLVTAIFASLQTLTELGLGAAIIQKRAELSREQFSALFWVSAALAIALVLALVVAAPWVADFYGQPDLSAMLRVYSLTLLAFVGYGIPRARLTYQLKFGRITSVEAAAGGVSAVLFIVLAYQGFGPWAILIGELASRLVMLVGFQLFSPFWPSRRADFHSVKKLVRFGLFAMGSRMLSEAYSNADYLVVGKLFQAHVLGIYGFAYRLVSDIGQTLRSSFVNVSFPTFSRLNDDKAALSRYLFGMARASIVLTGVVLIPLAALLEPLLRLFRYEEWLQAVPYAQVFVLVAIVRAAHVLTPRMLNALGYSATNFLFSACNAVLLPLSFYLGGIWFGLQGVVWAWGIAFPLSIAWYAVLAHSKLEVSYWRYLWGMFSGVLLLVPGAAAVAAFAYGLTTWGYWTHVTSLGAILQGVLTVGALLTALALCAAVPFLTERDNLRKALARPVSTAD